jgi:hypothetical protein
MLGFTYVSIAKDQDWELWSIVPQKKAEGFAVGDRKAEDRTAIAQGITPIHQEISFWDGSTEAITSSDVITPPIIKTRIADSEGGTTMSIDDDLFLLGTGIEVSSTFTRSKMNTNHFMDDM